MLDVFKRRGGQRHNHLDARTCAQAGLERCLATQESSALAQTDKAETTIAYLVEIEPYAIVGNAQASRVGCQRQAEEHM